MNGLEPFVRNASERQIMIVCQCNIITVKDIEQAIEGLLRDDPWKLVVPVQVYHALGKRGRCCGCFPGVVDIIVRVTESLHRTINSPEAELICFVDRLREVHRRLEEDRKVIREQLNSQKAA